MKIHLKIWRQAHTDEPGAFVQYTVDAPASRPNKACAGAAKAPAISRSRPSPAPQRGTDVTLHLRDGEDEFLSTWKLKSIISKYSDHITLPILMKKEEWDEEARQQVVKDEWETGQQGRGAVDPPQERHHRRAVPGVLQADQLRQRGAAGLHAQPGRGPHRVHAAAVHPGARRRSTCGTATSAAASSSTSSASSSWTTPRR